MKQMTEAQKVETRHALSLFRAFLKSDISMYADTKDKALTDVLVPLTQAFPEFTKWWILPDNHASWQDGTVEKEFFSVFSYGEVLFDFANAVTRLKRKTEIAEVGLYISYVIDVAVSLHAYVRNSDHETLFDL